MSQWSWEQIQQADAEAVWHPYSPANASLPPFPVARAEGVRLTLADGRELIDGMSSWWCAIHGYNHPVINQALSRQLQEMSHVMFGGLTHEPAAKLAKMLVDLTPEGLERVFFSDSGSVAVEVAVKMAIQFWQATGHSEKQKLVALRSAYHGDTFMAMSLCDPVTGMHHLFGDTLPTQHFIPMPTAPFGEPCPESEMAALTELLEQQHREIAAVIVEPIVQGAGGMRFYSADYLVQLRALCDAFGVILIFDEIATGFGRTGKLFAMEHAGVVPDILTIGKAMTGGYMTLAATLCSDRIAAGISEGEAGAFMHGPTFMANPLACSAAIASTELLISQPWARKVARLQLQLESGLAPARKLPNVAEVRTLGAIGVIELREPVDMQQVQPMFVDKGIWVRPFGKLVYAMPPFISSEEDIATLCAGMVDVVAGIA